jgi:flagellar biosynthesis anti-sigma factor FlgM
MRIDLNYAPPTTSETNRSVQNAAAGTSAAGADLGEDQAQLSGAHVQVQALATLASQLPEVREERVQTLRQAVSNGQYQVSPDEVAGALLAHLTAQRAA